MFEIFQHHEAPKEEPLDKGQELKLLNDRIAELQNSISKWDDPVPADRDLLHELLEKRNQLEQEMATGERE